MARESTNDVIYAAVSRLLMPLVKLLIRNGISFGAFSEVAKRVYVDVSKTEFKIPEIPQTNTRIATLTGLSRKEVLRITNEIQAGTIDLTDQHNRATRVVSGWIREPEFHDKRGRPAALPFEGEHRSFSRLVKMFSGDIPARTILDELVHSGSVKHLKDNRINLVTNAYIPASDTLEQIRMLGTDVSDLIATIDHNIVTEADASFFQRKVCYNNIPQEHLDKLKKLIVREAQSALETMNSDMARFDRDSTPDIEGTGRKRAGISIFYFENNPPAAEDNDD